MRNAKSTKMTVVSRVRIPGVGEYIRVRSAKDKEYWVKAGHYDNGMYYDPLVNITIPPGSVTEVPAIQREVEVAIPDL